MAWKPADASGRPEKVFAADLRKRVRILVDESLGSRLAEVLRDRGHNAVFAGEVGLAGKSDEDVAAYGWRDDRMVWTHDDDFLDDWTVPEHRNPGIIVLPGGGGNDDALIEGLATAINNFSSGPDLWRKCKIKISSNGEMTTRSRDFGTGKMMVKRLRFVGDELQIWEDD